MRPPYNDVVFSTFVAGENVYGMNSSGNTFHEFDVASNLAFKIVLFVSLLITVASGESSITLQPDFTSFPGAEEGI